MQWLPYRTLRNEALGSWFSEHVQRGMLSTTFAK
jgi:hypothetical protein